MIEEKLYYKFTHIYKLKVMHSEGVSGSTPTKEQKCHKICRNTNKCGAMFVKVRYLEIFAFSIFGT